MLCISLPTNLVDTKCYGIREVMGLQRCNCHIWEGIKIG